MGQHQTKKFLHSKRNNKMKNAICGMGKIFENHISDKRLISKPYQGHIQSELSEIELNGSLTPMELKKPHPSRLTGGEETWNEWVPHPCVVD